MMRPDNDVEVFVCREVVDMRKAINGLSILVEEVLELDPFANKLFVFCNRNRDKLKILYWERTGFVLWYKKLEKHRFPWPRREGEEQTVALTGEQLNWLLDGIDFFRLEPHEELSYQSVR
jgi:transposase